jgi:hypothetical protein
MLNGALSPAQIRLMALEGHVRGAIKAPGRKKHILLPRHVVPSLIVELEFSAQPPPKKIRRTFGPVAV